MHQNFVVCWAVLFSASPLFAQKAINPAPARPSIEQLIEQLAANRYTERKRAAELIKACGPQALPALRKAILHRDPEVREQVQKLIQSLEIVQALEPKRVTIKPKKQTLWEVLKEIEQQTGYAFYFDETLEVPMDAFELTNVPFWEALEEIGKQTSHRVFAGSGRDANLEQQGIQLKLQEKQAPTLLSGPFRVQAVHFHEDRETDFTRITHKRGIERQQLLTLTVSIMAEPRFIILSTDPSEVEVAVDEYRNSLEYRQLTRDPDFLGRAVYYRQNPQAEYQAAQPVLLRRTSEKAKTIRNLRGTIPVQMVIGKKPVVVTDKFLESKGLNFKIGDDTLSITELESQPNEGYYVCVTVPVRTDSDFERRWWDRIHLHDADGNAYTISGRGSQRSGINVASVTLNFQKSENPKLGLPAKLIIDDWVTTTHRVPFEFKELPLP